MSADSETIRWPTKLDRAAIELRLTKLAESARALHLAEVSERFADVKAMTAAQIASNVIACLTWLFDRPEHERGAYEAITRDLEMVALNLKNLK